MRPYPILGEALFESNSAPIDLSVNNTELKKFSTADNQAFSRYIFKKKFRYGGYLEERSIYQKSPMFEDGEKRNMHLGMDIWGPVGQPIFAPIGGRIVSYEDNEGMGNYGPTLIIKHPEGFHTLYGHLSREGMQQFFVGEVVRKGQQIGALGSELENGNWPPHVHFQIIKELEDDAVDYPGVCSKSELEAYKVNCPDPSHLVI